ncbi:uncharacterized protein LOC133477364, partial [Phyllopteryx taeniolatus]|uniref:uncharacterized protein LOC133477364 n=1 Tax=Phyllopteryx taeniolatus TaxID=161469 RepID=UPI002AD40EC4
TLNVGTMTGKSRELVDMMIRRKVDILCVQETRWKGSKARSLGAGFKLFYHGVDGKRNGVGVILKEELAKNVLEVKRVSDRVMRLKFEIEGVMCNVISGYAPQVGCDLEVKEKFWKELDDVEVKKRVQAGWNGWRKVSGVLCDRRVSARMKGKVYKTVVRPAMMYGLETVALKRKQEAELEVAEMKMLRFALGVTRLDKIRNELIRGTAKVRCFGDKVRESRLQWFGHVQRRESEYIGRRMMRMELPGKRARGRPKRRLMDVVREDMMAVGVREEDAGDRLSWKRM